MSGSSRVRRSPVNEKHCQLSGSFEVACRSPREGVHAPKVGHHLGFKTHSTMDINYDDAYRVHGTWQVAKSTVWVDNVRASDQVRQRMAWTLLQIVVVGAGLQL